MPDTSWYCMPVCVLWSLGFSDFPGTTCGSWNCNPGCAGHTTNVCPPQWDFWALNVSGKAAWWPTNLAKYSEDNLWKKNVYITWKLILKNCLDILPYPSIVHILVTLLYLFPPFLNKKTHKTSRWITVTAFMVLDLRCTIHRNKPRLQYTNMAQIHTWPNCMSKLALSHL